MTKKKSKDKKENKKNKPESKHGNFEKEIEKLKNELKEKNEKNLRIIADLQNYQKRMEKEIKSIKEETKKKYLNEIIDLYELLNKAYEDNNPKKGLELLLKNIKNFFKNENIECIDCIGKDFNHNYHHAITTVEKNNCKDNVVLEEVKKGYLIDDKLLRPAQVIVSKSKDKNKN